MVIKYFVASVGFLLCVVLFTLHISYNPVPCFTKSTYAQCLTVIKLRLPPCVNYTSLQCLPFSSNFLFLQSTDKKNLEYDHNTRNFGSGSISYCYSLIFI